ncbi:hypothetical protein SUGI_1225660 [Cryptomeria japonica]|uniref:Uncharacterized protein n=1 Tax=Cryptomeria japonica TaxID=3369 RepID=A0AAD3NMT8_CRYJA|nr:hypothetical protein SUGI_1225660 [Cryptomeria japonica]
MQPRRRLTRHAQMASMARGSGTTIEHDCTPTRYYTTNPNVAGYGTTAGTPIVNRSSAGIVTVPGSHPLYRGSKR